MPRHTRREFIRSAALGAGLIILARPASARAYAANERVNVALVGVGGRDTRCGTLDYDPVEGKIVRHKYEDENPEVDASLRRPYRAGVVIVESRRIL